MYFQEWFDLGKYEQTTLKVTYILIAPFEEKGDFNTNFRREIWEDLVF